MEGQEQVCFRFFVSFSLYCFGSFITFPSEKMVIPGNGQLQEPTVQVPGMWDLRALVEELREQLLFLSHYERLFFSQELKNMWLLEVKTPKPTKQPKPPGRRRATSLKQIRVGHEDA